MAGHGSEPAQDRANDPARKVGRESSTQDSYTVADRALRLWESLPPGKR